MKLNAYTNVQPTAAIGIYPLLTTLFLLAIHLYSGALDWPSEGDFDAQRDFNSAIGMSVLTGYFWLTLRMLHQNVASCLISILVKTNQLGRFSYHRERLSSDFSLHLFTTVIISILLTVIYVITEGLISTKYELHVLLLTATAVPFWFFSWLFLFQVTSNIRYIINHVLTDSVGSKDYLDSLVSLVKLGVTNGIFAMGAVSIVPIFWFKKDIPSLDVFLLTIFSATITVYLFFPVLNLRLKLRRAKRKALNELDSMIGDEIAHYNQRREGENVHTLEHLENEKESILGLSTSVIKARDKVRIAACIGLVPVSWSLVSFIEWLVASPFTQ